MEDKPECDKCGLYRNCRSPKMPVTGMGRRGVLVVAEAPGQVEDEQGMQLIGPAGQVLRRLLHSIGADLDGDCWKTNAIICRPAHNARPTRRQIGFCRPNLMQTIKERKPQVILLLGSVAVEALLGEYWTGTGGFGRSITRWVGWQIPLWHLRCWVICSYHPSYVLRQQGKQLEAPLTLWMKKHLRSAFALRERPQEGKSCVVDVMERADVAAKAIREMAKGTRPVAIDYETNSLKCDRPEAKILSCALCDGQRAIAYLWQGEVIEATGELLRSNVPKIVANLQFEWRWTQRMFGHGIRNILIDTVLAAHVEDNRRTVTSVKFQAFVKLGVLPYDREVKRYMSGVAARDMNRLEELPKDVLLRYNGLDARYEWELGMRLYETTLSATGSREGSRGEIQTLDAVAEGGVADDWNVSEQYGEGAGTQDGCGSLEADSRVA